MLDRPRFYGKLSGESSRHPLTATPTDIGSNLGPSCMSPNEESRAKMNTVDLIYRCSAATALVRPSPQDSRSALRRLLQGNRGFAALLDQIDDESGSIQQIIPVDPRDLGLMTGLPKQHPFAVVLGCSDARVPVELIFNEGPNDLFVIRVAGNGLGPEVLGSLSYAIDNLGGSLKLIVVLGHSGCGALTAAVDIFLNPADYLPFATKHPLRNILDRLLVVVQTSAKKLLSTFGSDVVLRPGYRKALLESSIIINSALAAYTIQREIGPAQPAMRTVYGVYLLETREVWAPRSDNVEETGLAQAPKDLGGFVELGDAVVRSARIASCINSQE
jgi:carbonic anhydrase